LAEDLRRFLAGEPILARPVGRLERAVKWVRLHAAVAVLLAAVVLSLVGGTAFSVYFAVQANNRADEALAQKKKAEAQLLRAEWLVYASKISLAQREWEANNAGLARYLLDQCRWDSRGWEHDYLHTLFNSNQPTLRGHTGPVWSVAFSPDGKRLASGSDDRTVKLWDGTTGQQTLGKMGPFMIFPLLRSGKIMNAIGGTPGEAVVCLNTNDAAEQNDRRESVASCSRSVLCNPPRLLARCRAGASSPSNR
jgi:hypothetical protein